MNTVKPADKPHAIVPPPAEPAGGMAQLKPKGACWYCNQPLDNIRRFCSKACADDYRIEEEVFRDLRR